MRQNGEGKKMKKRKGKTEAKPLTVLVRVMRQGGEVQRLLFCLGALLRGLQRRGLGELGTDGDGLGRRLDDREREVRDGGRDAGERDAHEVRGAPGDGALTCVGAERVGAASSAGGAPRVHRGLVGRHGCCTRVFSSPGRGRRLGGRAAAAAATFFREPMATVRVCASERALLVVDRNANARGDPSFRDQRNWRKFQGKREALRTGTGRAKERDRKCERKRKRQLDEASSFFSISSPPPPLTLASSSSLPFRFLPFHRALPSRAHLSETKRKNERTNSSLLSKNSSMPPALEAPLLVRQQEQQQQQQVNEIFFSWTGRKTEKQSFASNSHVARHSHYSLSWIGRNKQVIKLSCFKDPLKARNGLVCGKHKKRPEACEALAAASKLAPFSFGRRASLLRGLLSAKTLMGESRARLLMP